MFYTQANIIHISLQKFSLIPLLLRDIFKVQCYKFILYGTSVLKFISISIILCSSECGTNVHITILGVVWVWHVRVGASLLYVNWEPTTVNYNCKLQWTQIHETLTQIYETFWNSELWNYITHPLWSFILDFRY